MKQNILVVLFFCIPFRIFATEFNVISSIGVQTDYLLEGTKGIQISYQYNFSDFSNKSNNDTILKDCSFTIRTMLYVDSEPIKIAEGYQAVGNESNEITYNLKLSSVDIEPLGSNQTVTQFIPYAALQLPKGKHTIKIKSELSGKDALGVFHQQKEEKDNIIFEKPETYLFTLNIDYIEVNELNTAGQAWDFAIFNTSAPDVTVNVEVGNTSVFKANVNDTYMFSVGPKSRNIQFVISKNDKVVFRIYDADIMFNDFIAKWIFSTNKMPGVVYTYKKPSGNIKSCFLSFKYE
ncbi:MAG: hypothetical protein KDD21_04120 [Bacteroidetes bacterium]|nr:hypothetical protein [Bacteroidota bacterium]